MIKPYNERHFCIDLIVDQYKTRKPTFISIKLDKELGEIVSPEEIQNYLNSKEVIVCDNRKKKSHTLVLDDIFERNSYEEKRHEDQQRYLRHMQ